LAARYFVRMEGRSAQSEQCRGTSERIHVTIDYRMSGSSGIGVYLRNIVARLISDYGDEFRLTLLGGIAEMGAARRDFRSSIYSTGEQIMVPLIAPRSTQVFWSPNYNAPFFSPGKLVVTIHDACHLAMPDLYRGAKRQYARALFANVRRRAERIIVDSQFTSDEVQRLSGIPRQRLTVIKPGIREWVSEIGPRPVSEAYLLYVGNVKPHKNLVRLLQAFERIKDEIPHSFVIVGRREGFLTPDREVISAADRIGNRVLFTGEVSDADLARYYKWAALLVHPSLYEGFGFPPLEAMSAGIPVAASNAGSIPEICGSAVQYFDPRSVESIAANVVRVLTDDSLRSRLIDAGRTQVTHYSWNRTVQQVAAVFRQTAGVQPRF
jgi:glycosyltransferase involved in cell wall biosynthesis